MVLGLHEAVYIVFCNFSGVYTLHTVHYNRYIHVSSTIWSSKKQHHTYTIKQMENHAKKI